VDAGRSVELALAGGRLKVDVQDEPNLAAVRTTRFADDDPSMRRHVVDDRETPLVQVRVGYHHIEKEVVLEVLESARLRPDERISPWAVNQLRVERSDHGAAVV